MNHECATNRQGSAPSTCGQMQTRNSDDSSPHTETWDWIGDLFDATLLTIALVAGSVVIGTAIFWIAK